MSDILQVTEDLLRHKELSVLHLLAPYEFPVLVAGAFHGDTIRALKHLDAKANIHGFEPQKHCHPSLDSLVEQEYHDVQIHKVALGTTDGVTLLHGPGNDFASLVQPSEAVSYDGTEEVQMVNAADYIKGLADRWSLLYLNVEGYEYSLLPFLEEQGVLDKFDNLLVQYHLDVVEGYDEEPPAIMGFDIIWNYYPSWVWWSRKWHK